MSLHKAIEYALLVFAFFVLFGKLHNWVEYLFFAAMIAWAIGKVRTGGFRLTRTSLDWPILLYLAWVLLTIPGAIDPIYSLAQWRKTVSHSLMFFCVVNVVRDEGQARRILLAFSGGVCVLSLIGITEGWIQHAVYGADLSTNWGVGSLTSGRTYFGSYLVMAVPLLFLGVGCERNQILKGFYGITAVASLGALFMTHQRAAWLAVIFQGGIYLFLWARSRKGYAVLALFIAVVTVLGIYGFGYFVNQPLGDLSSMKYRAVTWKVAFDDILDHPITGIGYGRDSFAEFHQITEEVTLTTGLHTHTHNEFLAAAVYTGIPGFLFLSWIFWCILVKSYKGWKRAPGTYHGRLAVAVFIMTLGVIMRNMFDEHMIGTLVYLFWLLVGLYFALSARLDEIANVAERFNHGVPHEAEARIGHARRAVVARAMPGT